MVLPTHASNDAKLSEERASYQLVENPYREADKTPGRKYNIGQKHRTQYRAKAENRQMLKITAHHMMNHHMVTFLEFASAGTF